MTTGNTSGTPVGSPAARALVGQRLAADELLDPAVAELVLAAFGGLADLDAFLSTGVSPSEAAGQPRQPLGAYISSVEVEGFRGIGPRVRLNVSPGPGLTLVVGRNGSGKSSIAEALEVLFTGDNTRWAARSAVWREGWRNLHHPTASISADLAVEGRSGPTRVSRSWVDGADLEHSESVVQPTGLKKTSLDSLGWDEALVNYRPFLSYNELGSMLDEGPSKLHDAVARVLGLDDLSEAEKSLRDARLLRERALKEVREQRDSFVAQLELLDDDRARAVAGALSGSPDFARAESVLAGTHADADRTEAAVLQRFLALDLPSAERVEELAGRLGEALDRVAGLAGTHADQLARTADLLEQAATFRADYPGTSCPVCGTEGVVSDHWLAHVKAEAEKQRAVAAEATSAREALQKAERQARSVIADFPPAARAVESMVDLTELLAAWRHWIELRDAPGSVVASELTTRATDVSEALAALKGEAAGLLQAQEDVWRPVAAALLQWLPGARSSFAAASDVSRLKRAEEWLKREAVEIRNERFAPISDEAAEIWRLLRHRSNVQLGKIELAGTGNRRRITLDVNVDGVEGAALGVMSQGELHALALSLFLPRATLDDSPFRFVVVDDPVQSMDPSKVDGLARVLDRAAKKRQVIVFTHDDRLPEAIRRLRISATVIEVARKERSVVELREALDPVERHIADARAIVRTSDIPAEVARRVVPGFCRLAVEAGCMAAVRRRRITRGEEHADVETLLTSATRLTSVAALALFDDAARGGDVLSRINRDFGRRYGDTFQIINRGAHDGTAAPLDDVVRDAAILARRLGELA